MLCPFIKRFGINKLLREVGATKAKGTPTCDIFAFLMGFVFTRKNCIPCSKSQAKKCHLVRTLFTMLTMGWSDAQTFLPISFRLLASGNKENLLHGSRIKENHRTFATKRRKEAQKEKPALVIEMLKSESGTCAQTKYVLFDSWFSSPSAIISVRSLGYHVVTRLKNNDKLRYL